MSVDMRSSLWRKSKRPLRPSAELKESLDSCTMSDRLRDRALVCEVSVMARVDIRDVSLAVDGLMCLLDAS